MRRHNKYWALIVDTDDNEARVIDPAMLHEYQIGGGFTGHWQLLKTGDREELRVMGKLFGPEHDIYGDEHTLSYHPRNNFSLPNTETQI